MKIAISSTGKTIDSKIDLSFVRCAYFVIFDSETLNVEFIENPSRTLQDIAGLAVVTLVNDFEIKKIISGELSLSIKTAFEDLKIQKIVDNDLNKSIHDILELLKNNK
jgi:predicted Fe-Mo cluster-binding NifX family protein